MQKRIVVPLDGSPLADRIWTQLRRVLVRDDAEVVLLTVVEPWLAEPARERRRLEARDHLEGIRETLNAEGATCTAEVRLGDPGEEIAAYAQRVGAELIVMASHGWSGVTRWIRGSVAERVLRTSSVPVLVANPWSLGRVADTRRFARILVPLDGSEVAGAIIPLVADVARLHGSEVILLRCDFVAPFLAYPYPVGPVLGSPKELEASLEPARRALEAQGITARIMTRFGQEAEAIVDTAAREDVDLVAMSTHGRSGLGRWVFGSVAETVIRHCDRPILVRRALPITESPAVSTHAAAGS